MAGDQLYGDSGAPNEDELLAKVMALVKDVSSKLTASDFSQMISQALRQYSRVKPNEAAVDVTGNGTHDYPVSGITGWVDEFSQVRSIEYPVDSVPAELLDEGDFEIYLATTGRALRLLSAEPQASETFRVTFTLPRTSATIASNDQDAVATLAASLCLEVLATRYLDTADPDMAADVVNYRSKSDEASRRAKAYAKIYGDHVGIKDNEGVAAASAVADLSVGYPGGGDRLTHPSRARRRRF